MNYINPKNKKDLIEAILEVDKSLLFHDVKTLNSKMKSISFSQLNTYARKDLFEFIGTINGQIIELTIAKKSNDASDHNLYLQVKVFYDESGVRQRKHRENDLPAKIFYRFGANGEHLKYMEYYISGKPKRLNIKDPVVISESEEETEFRYGVPNLLTENNFYICNIIILNKSNSVKSAIIQYGKSKFPLETLIDMVPETVNFKLEDLMNLNERLSLVEKKLIEMATI